MYKRNRKLYRPVVKSELICLILSYHDRYYHKFQFLGKYKINNIIFTTNVSSLHQFTPSFMVGKPKEFSLFHNLYWKAPSNSLEILYNKAKLDSIEIKD